MIDKNLISIVEKNYSTTPLLIASDLRDINRLIDVDVVGYYFRGKRILDTILESCTGNLKLYFNNEQEALKCLSERKLLPINIRENIEILYIEYTNQLTKKIFNGHAQQKFVSGIYRLENVVRWFMDVVYPKLVDDDYFIIFESENNEIPVDIFNKKTIEFNNIVFGVGTSRDDADEYVELNNINPYLHLYAVTKYTYDIIGALEIYPLSDSFAEEYENTDKYDQLFNKDAIPYNAIREYLEPGFYKIFVDTVVTHQRFRGKYTMLRRLFERFTDLFISMADEGIYISNVYGDTWTDDGRKLAEYFKMQKVRNTVNGELYKLSLMPPPDLTYSRVIPRNMPKLLKINREIEEHMHPSVFISYNHVDHIIAAAIKEKLENNGLKVIIDSKDLKTGQNISDFIKECIRQSGVTLSLVSANSLVSSWVAMETICSTYNEISQRRYFMPCNIDKSIFKKSFIDDALDKIDNDIEEINNAISNRVNKNRGIEDLQEERTRINRLRNELPTIVGMLKQRLCVDLSQENYENGIMKLIQDIRSLGINK